MEREEALLRLRERIVGFAASQFGRDTAEDLAQEVLALLEEKYRHITGLEDLLPLSLQILRFKMMSFRRKSLRRGEHTQVSIDDAQLPSREPDAAAELERKERLAHLSEALGRLGKRCQELFRLKLEGKSFTEIKSLMRAASINTIYTWDYRCRKDLLELMGGSWDRPR